MRPTVLVATTCRWFPTVRLAMALSRAGFMVEVLCPPRHPIENTELGRHTYTYRGLAPLMSFRKAIRSSKADLIVSGDDLATTHLHHLHERERAKGTSGKPVCELIERSLGAPESFKILYARSTFIQLARQEGVRAPETRVVENISDLLQWISKKGFPVVLKANGSSGGDGVRIVHSLEQAELAFRMLQAPPLLVRAAKRALVDKDKTLVWSSLFRRRATVNAQVCVSGSETTSTVACWKGRVLAALHCDVVHKRDAAGPATVLRVIDDPDMSMAAERMVRRLNLSGVHGFDFMRDTETRKAYLIEINPRATQVGHLTLGNGRDIPAALYAAISGEAICPAAPVTEKDVIALFPQEWMREPASTFLQSAYHDVPWDEPDLIRACVRKRAKRTPWAPTTEWSATPTPVPSRAND